MNLGTLALSYARRSAVTTLLNILLLALGVATIVLLILLGKQLDYKLERDARGIDLVVGAKGSPLQLILAGVYYVDAPPGNIPLSSIYSLRTNPLVAQVIPLSLGDSYQGFRIVGTEPAFVVNYGARVNRGRLWQAPLEAVLGAEVAQRTGLALGDQFYSSHGLAVGGEAHKDSPYHVVGILAETGTAIDRLVVTGLDSVWKIHEQHEHYRDEDDRSEMADKQVTMALVRYASPLAAASLPRQINSQTSLQAASPAYESARLFTIFGFGTDIIRGFAAVMIVAACLGIFVALYRALHERRYDIAVMRTLGAGRRRVFGLLLLESLLLAGTGTVSGLILAHLLVAAIGSWVPAAAALSGGAWHWFAEEWIVIAATLGGGLLAGLLPAWRAYRLDVAATLARG